MASERPARAGVVDIGDVVDQRSTVRAPDRPTADGGLAVEAVGLTRRFGDVVVVDHLDLGIRRGELFALLGPNGAGKTTTIRMACGLLRPTSGTISVGGHDLVADPLGAKRILAVSPQETAIAEHLDAWENLALMARLHGVDAPTTRARSAELLEMLGLAGRADERVRRFSGGMKRRLSIAMALVSDPEVLFLDEPTLGLDPQSRRGLWEHIGGLKGRITVVLTTHYLEEADALADRIAVIDRGRVVTQGTPDQLKSSIEGGRATVVVGDLDDVAIAALTVRFGEVRPGPDGVEIADPEASLSEIVDVLRPLGVAPRSIARRTVTLDDVFVELTGRELRE